MMRHPVLSLDAGDRDGIIRSFHMQEGVLAKADTKTERDAFTLRLRPDLLNFVKQQAEEENRSVPNFVETVLLAEKRRREARNQPLGEVG